MIIDAQKSIEKSLFVIQVEYNPYQQKILCTLKDVIRLIKFADCKDC